MSYKCIQCNKTYKTYQTLWNHNKIFHSNINKKSTVSQKIEKSYQLNKNNCQYCKKQLSRIDSLKRHESNCKYKEKIMNKYAELEEENKKLKNNKTINNETINNETIPNQLINIIIDKTKKIEELNEIITINKNDDVRTENESDEIQNNSDDNNNSLIYNNIIINSRVKDNYINASKICQSGNKNFNDWQMLDSTNELINELAIESGINAKQLIDVKKCYWIHPDLAIQLAQWISPIFALKISKWITNRQINVKITKEIQIKDQQIKLLQDLYVKKQQRKDYPEKNVIYMLTTEDNKKKRIYIIGKAKQLKDRLSSYNKTAEHEVIYYKECKNKESMNIVELMVLYKLDEFREKANRDRFILPVEKEISFFTNIIDSAINFF